MKIAYITCIKNEEKLIYYNLMYYFNMGVDVFFVMFNNSEDKSKDEVTRFERDTRIKVNRLTDNNIAYMQPKRFTNMANQAFQQGCEWIIPVDADEIVRIQGNMPFKMFLEKFREHPAGYINCRWIDYHATEKDDMNDPNYFTRWKYRQSVPRDPSKIVVKWHPNMKFGDGHHILTAHRSLIVESKIMWYAHFYGREADQLKRKTEIIGQAFVDAFGQSSQRPQVLNYHRVKAEGQKFHDDAWNRLCRFRKAAFNSFVYDPIPENLFIAPKKS